jgi:hypothetical protein
MMKIMTCFLAVFALFTSTSDASARTFILKPKYAFTPKGFDTNDNAQVVLAGAFSDYCMKVGTTRHTVDKVKKKIFIQQTYSTGENCHDIEMYIPYSIEVNLGTLPKGNYEVHVLDMDNQYTLMSQLPISEAKSSNGNQVDERLYAPVTSIEFKTGRGEFPLLVINGVFSNTCLSLSGVEVHQRMGDVFEVLPVAVDRKRACAAALQPYSKTVELKGFTLRDTLIHVRSMNGQSINKVVTTLDRLQ